MASQTQLPQFDAASKKELEDFIEQEQSKAKMQATVHELTNTCWKTSAVPVVTQNSKFSKNEANCLSNCVDRWLDSSLYIVKQIESQQSQLQPPRL